jgi:hypothetical protein
LNNRHQQGSLLSGRGRAKVLRSALGVASLVLLWSCSSGSDPERTPTVRTPAPTVVVERTTTPGPATGTAATATQSPTPSVAATPVLVDVTVTPTSVTPTPLATVALPAPTARPPSVTPRPPVASKPSINSVTSPVSRGSSATVVASTTPGVLCTIQVTSAANATVSAVGLGNKRVDGSGKVSWSWVVGPATPLGAGRVTISCGGSEEVSAVLVVR